MTVFITALYIGYAAKCDGRGGFHILWIWFSNCTAFYVGCKPHIVLILSGVIWCRYVALYAYGVFSFTYVINFIVIIDLTRCCFLQNGALGLVELVLQGLWRGSHTERAAPRSATSRTAFWSRCWAPRTDAEWRRRCAYTHRKQCVQIWKTWRDAARRCASGVRPPLQCAVDIVEGFMLSIFVLLTGLRYAHFWCAVIQYFSHPVVMFFHLIFVPTTFQHKLTPLFWTVQKNRFFKLNQTSQTCVLTSG